MKRYWLTLRQYKKKGKWFSEGVRAAMITTTRCPLRCNYCPMYIYGDVKKYEESTFDEWRVWFERFPYWISQIYVSGGEPSLYKDIVPLVNWLVERGHHVIVFTILWKVENYEGIKPHWRLLFMPTLHQGDRVERFKNAVATLEGSGHQVTSQQLFENQCNLKRVKEFFTADWFKNEDRSFQFAPDTPRTLTIYAGCANLYRKEDKGE